jgi:SAM-dependent methyltransferase
VLTDRRHGEPPTKSTLRRCPVCNGRTAQVLHTQHFVVPRELAVADRFDVVSCMFCGAGFADLPTQQELIDDAYREHSKYVDHGHRADPGRDDQFVAPEPRWDLERLEQTASFLSGFIEDRTTRILDAGCATGALLGYFKARGFHDVVGLDPSPSATAIARRGRGVEAIAASFMAPPPQLGTFGLVTLTHVLEHIADLDAAITRLRDLVDEGGLAYIEVPDARHYADHLVAPFQDFNTEHINHFSLPTLSAAMSAGGFEAVTRGEKVIGCSQSHTYPAIYGIWRKNAAIPGQVSTRRDDSLVEGLTRYTEMSKRLLRDIDDRLRDVVTAHESVIVWGAGQLAMKLLCDTVLATAPIAAIVDGSTQKQGLHFANHVVQGPGVVQSLPGVPIVIASMLHDDSIIDSIKSQSGDANPVIRLGR